MKRLLAKTELDNPSTLTQVLKWRGDDFCAASAIGRDAPDFIRFAAWVAAYPGRRRRRLRSEIRLIFQRG
jgi:hypothetical protein